MAKAAAGRRILIVDDNIDLAENIAEILELQGYVTEVASSAEDALSKVGLPPPDVIVTDYRLPGIDGAAFVRHLKTLGVSVTAIVISAFTDDDTIEDARSAGASFVAKPVDFEILRRLVRE